MLEGFVDLMDFDELGVVVLYELLDTALEHLVRIELVNAALVDVFQQPVLAAVAHQKIIHMISDVLSESRNDHIGLTRRFVKSDKVGARQQCSVINAVTRLNAFFNRFPAVILAFPLLAVERRLTKDLVDRVGVITHAKGDHRAEREVCL